MSAAVLSVVLFAATPAHASTLYTYTGNLLTDVISQGQTAPVDAYSTTDRVTGFIELAGPLAPNLGWATTLTPLSFSFFDGVNTISNATATLSAFQVKTDAAANIVNWLVRVRIEALEPGGDGTVKEIITTNYVDSSSVLRVGDDGTDVLCGPVVTTGFCTYNGSPFYAQYGYNRGAAGMWRTTSVPEPTSTLLMGAALLGFGALRRRRA